MTASGIFKPLTILASIGEPPMLLYQCDKCEKTFSALSPEMCPYCQYKHLRLLSNYKVQVYNVSDIQPKHNKYSVKFDLPEVSNENETQLPEILCNILRLPSISIRHSIDNPYVGRIKRCHSACDKKGYETPITTELRVYSPNRAYVLLDSESDEIFDYISTQYKQRDWEVLDLRNSQISFVNIIRKFFKTHVVPRLKNDATRKDIECIAETETN